MTDTPVKQPPEDTDKLKAFIGDLARPFAIYATSGAAAIATVMVAYRTEDGTDAALLMAAIYAGIGALYVGKAWENSKASKDAANVEIAKAKAE